MHKRARKAEILILVMMPKLLIKRANTPKTIPLKISRGRTILFPVLIDTTTPLAMKNNSSHQASTSGTENRCLSFVKVHGKGPRRTPTKDHKEFFTNVTGLSSPVFITTEELCPRLFFTAGTVGSLATTFTSSFSISSARSLAGSLGTWIAGVTAG